MLIQHLARTLAGWTDPAVLTLDAEARAFVIEVEEYVEGQLGPAGTLEHVADWGAKLVGATLRIAGLVHLGEHPEDGWRRPVAVGTVRRAVQLAGYYRQHALAAFAAMQSDPVVTDAAYLLEVVIPRLDAEAVTQRDLFTKASRSRFRKVADLAAPLQVLEDHGYLLRQPEPLKEGPGRRPSPRWTVHPSMTAQTAQTAKTGRPGLSAVSAVSAAPLGDEEWAER